MSTNVEGLARQIVRDIRTCTNNRPQQWVSLPTIAERLALTDDAAIKAALQHAIHKGWMIVEGGHSLCLTDAGRRMTRR